MTATRPPGHRHVSEREIAHRWRDGRWDDAHWEDCAWCSAVMFARLTWDPTIPATHTEAEALRAAAGEPPLGGSNTDDVLRGFGVRYGYKPAVVLGFDLMWSIFTPGTVALTMGYMGVFPRGHDLRRWDPAFSGAHATMSARTDPSSTAWWDDPLAPTGGYQGQSIKKADLQRYMNALGKTKTIIGRMKEASVTPKEITSQTPASMNVNKGAVLYDLDGVTALGKLGNESIGRYSPYAVGGQRAGYFNILGLQRIALVTPAAGTVKAIPPASASQLKAAEALGVAKEKSRLRKFLSL